MTKPIKQFVAIDDSQLMTLLFSSITTLIECETFITESFDEAIDFCSNNKVDVIISDLYIGQQSGFDVISEVRKNPLNATTKCFICSSESPGAHKEKLQDININGWILKPIDIGSFKTVLQKLLESP